MARTKRFTDEFGAPGAHAVHLARRAALRAAVWTTLALVCCALAVLCALASSWIPAVVAAVVAIGFAQMAKWRFVDVERAVVGARSERRVAKAIVSARPRIVIHGALLGAGGDADHVVLGPVAVAVETKTGYGHVRADGQSLIAGSRRIPGDPVLQAKRQAAALGKLAQCWVEAVVCISDMENAPFSDRGVTVCSPSDLPAVLADAGRPLDEQRAYALTRSILGH